VDPEFGTGCVKITPAHDFNDYQVWSRHRDETPIAEQPHGGLINIFTESAAVRDNLDQEGELIPAAYVGLDRYDARKKILSDLEDQELLEKTDPHKLMVPRGDRSNAVIEPFLTDQWYVKIKPLAEPAIKAVETGAIKFVPDNWKNTYFEWMRNIEDWCISRQIWWGHRIPAWYDKDGNIYVGRNEDEVRQQHKLPDDLKLQQDEDVLDTWFSSALWPFSTLGWPEQTERVETFYPTSVLVTGFDIIFFWVARMIMMGIKFMDDVPFREVYIHGLVRDAHGQKMSKSKGNVLDPIDLIDGIELDALVEKRTSGMMQPHLAEKIGKQTRKDFPDGIPAFGTDALRFTFAALASTGRDINFDLGRIEGYRNFCNKLWNAARYVLMNTEGEDTGLGSSDIEFSAADKWITSRLQETIKTAHKSIASYRFDLMATAIYEFVWHDYCDWYLELSKPTLMNKASSAAAKRGTRQTLVSILETLLRLAHPIIPYITEEIWQRVAPLCGVKGNTIMLQPYPEANNDLVDSKAVDDMDWVQAFILGVRKIRSGYDIKPGKALPVLLQNGTDDDRQRLVDNELYLTGLAKLDTIVWLGDNEQAPESATSLVGEMKILIPMEGFIDKEAEIQRLRKEIDKNQQNYDRIEKKLENPKFVEKAPPEVVEKERSKLSELKIALEKLQEQLEKISKL
jgi:valyl-tRNA synthetase